LGERGRSRAGTASADGARRRRRGSVPRKTLSSRRPTPKNPQKNHHPKPQYGLVHISAGDLLREQVALGTPEGLRAKEFMDKGALVPDEVVVDMVKARLAQPDARQNGWLLDGYPRSGSQAEAIEREGIRPDIFLLLEVPDELLVERVVGRRMDPTTGAIYHLKYNPPPPEAVPRLVQRSDDTEEKAVARLDTHRRNVDAVMGYYADKCVPVKGDRAMAEVFSSIEQALDEALLKASDPMESFCEGNPSEPECRVYDE
jgi:adenylate kinase